MILFWKRTTKDKIEEKKRKKYTIRSKQGENRLKFPQHSQVNATTKGKTRISKLSNRSGQNSVLPFVVPLSPPAHQYNERLPSMRCQSAWVTLPFAIYCPCHLLLYRPYSCRLCCCIAINYLPAFPLSYALWLVLMLSNGGCKSSLVPPAVLSSCASQLHLPPPPRPYWFYGRWPQGCLDSKHWRKHSRRAVGGTCNMEVYSATYSCRHNFNRQNTLPLRTPIWIWSWIAARNGAVGLQPLLPSSIPVRRPVSVNSVHCACMLLLVWLAWWAHIRVFRKSYSE